MRGRSILCIGIFLLAAYINSTAQSDIRLPGEVVIQNSKYNTGELQYVPGASIVSPVKSIPTSSDSRGRFTLVFSDKPVGDIARIIVRKEGLELVNTKELEAAAVVGRLTPLHVVMCKQGTLDENRMAYYEVSIKEVQKNYDERHKILLEKQGANYQKVVQSLEREFKRTIQNNEEALTALDSQLNLVKKQALDLSEKFVIVNLDDESATYQRAFRAFSAGSVDLAIAILDSIDLEQRLTDNKVQKDKAEAAIGAIKTRVDAINVQMQQDVNQCILKARMYKIKKDYTASMNSYELAARYDTADIGILRELKDVYFYTEIEAVDDDKLSALQNKELELLKKIVVKTREKFESDPLFDKTIFLSDLRSLGASYEFNKKDIPAAQGCFTEELSLGRKLAQQDPGLYRVALYTSLRDNGDFTLRNGKFETADNYFKEGLSVMKELSAKDPRKYSPVLFEYLNYVGKMYKGKDHFADALPFFEENFKITSALYARDTLTYQNDLFEIIQNFTELYLAKNDYAKAEAYVPRFFAMWEQIKGTQSEEKYGAFYDWYIPYFLKELADFYEINNDSVKAETYYLKALETLRQPGKYSSPVNNRQSLAESLKTIGDFYRKRNNFKKAEASYLESLNLDKELVQENPAYEPSLAIILNDMGVLYDINKYFEKADQYYLESLEISRRLAKSSPKYNEPQLELVLNNLGILSREEKDYAKAEAYFREAYEIRSRLYDQYPATYDNELTATISDLIAVYTNPGSQTSLKGDKWPSIVLLQKKAVDVYEKKFRDHPGDKDDAAEYAESLGNLSYYLLFSKKFSAAEEAARKGMLIDNTQTWIATNLAPALLFQGKYSDAEKQYLYFKPLKDKEGTSFKNTMLKDLDDLEKAGITHPDVVKIRRLLKE